MKKVQILGMGCPKCKLLAANAENAAQQLGVDIALEKVTDINEIMKLGVMTTPAIVIDGEVKLAGKVATVDELKSLLK